MIQPAANAAALDALLSKADPARVSRAYDYPMQYVEWMGSQWYGVCANSEGTLYKSRITLTGQRGFNCTCPDRRWNAAQVGPCKHVIALALEGFQMLAQTLPTRRGSTAVTAA